jgi:hypothetical protein
MSDGHEMELRRHRRRMSPIGFGEEVVDLEAGEQIGRDRGHVLFLHRLESRLRQNRSWCRPY